MHIVFSSISSQKPSLHIRKVVFFPIFIFLLTLYLVRFYQKQVGVEAARMLLQMLEHPENGGPVRQTTLGYSVVDRGSIRMKEDA